jgi:hypothetical protein
MSLGSPKLLMALFAATFVNCVPKKTSSKSLSQLTDPGVFQCPANAIPNSYLEYAVQTHKLEVATAKALFNKAKDTVGFNDPITGFALSIFHRSSIFAAMDWVSVNTKFSSFYIEADIKNLGGLNSHFGANSEANKVFSKMTQLSMSSLLNLVQFGNENKVCPIRHGGDEFSFVVVSDELTLKGVNDALRLAQDEIRAYVEKEGLNNIEHPKHPPPNTQGMSKQNADALTKMYQKYRGTGVYFGVAPIRATLPEFRNSDLEKVIRAADCAVNKNKKDIDQIDVLEDAGVRGDKLTVITERCLPE